MTEQQFRPAITSFASGFFSWLGDLILYPIDTISTRLKGSRTNIKTGTMRFIMDSIKRERMGLYRGVSLTFPHSFVPTILYVYIYENLMRVSSQIVDRLTDHKAMKLIFPFFASSIAQMIALVLELPFDTVRTRIQMNTEEYQYSSAMVGLREIQKQEGILRFYKSTRIYFATKTLYTAVQFQVFEMLNYVNGGHAASFLNAIISAVIATTFVNPLEVLITRYALVDTTKKKLVFSYMVKRLWQREGFKGFYKGYVTETLTHTFYALLWLPVFQFMREKYGVNLAE